jgi:hypothetical protein
MSLRNVLSENDLRNVLHHRRALLEEEIMDDITGIHYNKSWAEPDPNGGCKVTLIRDLKLVRDGNGVIYTLMEGSEKTPLFMTGKLPLEFLANVNIAIPTELCEPNWGREHLARYTEADSKLLMRIVLAKANLRDPQPKPSILIWDFNRHVQNIPPSIRAMVLTVDYLVEGITAPQK